MQYNVQYMFSNGFNALVCNIANIHCKCYRLLNTHLKLSLYGYGHFAQHMLDLLLVMRDIFRQVSSKNDAPINSIVMRQKKNLSPIDFIVHFSKFSQFRKFLVNLNGSDCNSLDLEELEAIPLVPLYRNIVLIWQGSTQEL